METYERKLEENMGNQWKVKGLIGAVNGLTSAVATKSVQKHMKN